MKELFDQVADEVITDKDYMPTDEAMTPEAWHLDCADLLFGEEEVTAELMKSLGNALYWNDAVARGTDSQKHASRRIQWSAESALRVGTIIIEAAIEAGLTAKKLGVDYA